MRISNRANIVFLQKINNRAQFNTANRNSCCNFSIILIVILDIHIMLIGGFGFLMTFMKRHGFSSLGYTLLIVTLVTEWAILMRGFLHMDDSYTIHLTFLE